MVGECYNGGGKELDDSRIVGFSELLANLTLWKEWQRSNEDLYRFDLICKVVRGKRCPFEGVWDMLW